MNRKEAKTTIEVMLSSGSKKGDVLAALSGQGIKDRVLANLIASRPDPERCRRNKLHVGILVALGILQLLFSLWIAYSLVADAASTGPLDGAGTAIVALFLAITVSLSLLFIWGFATYRVAVYHAYIVLLIVQIPKLIGRLSTDPAGSLGGIVISIALVAYIYFVRNRLFPDFVWFSPRKAGGQYVFADRG
ncbi:permease [Burkholderia sp. MR1-5-21]